MYLGNALRRARRLGKITQLEASQIMHVCRATYCGWELNKGCPSFIQVCKLTKALKIELEDFIKIVELEN